MENLISNLENLINGFLKRVEKQRQNVDLLDKKISKIERIYKEVEEALTFWSQLSLEENKKKVEDIIIKIRESENYINAFVDAKISVLNKEFNDRIKEIEKKLKRLLDLIKEEISSVKTYRLITPVGSGGGKVSIGGQITGGIEGCILFVGENGVLSQDPNKLYISSSGNVGIGTNSPSSKLTISGDLSLTGKVFTNEVVLGLNTSLNLLDGLDGQLVLKVPNGTGKVWFSGADVSRGGVFDTVNKCFNPLSNNFIDLGRNDRYWANTYTVNLYLNSTAYLSGSVAGEINITGNTTVKNIFTVGDVITENFNVSGKTASGTIQYGYGSYFNDGYTHRIRVYPAKIDNEGKYWVNETKYFDSPPVSDDGAGNNNYQILWNWSSVAGADGYVILKEDDFNSFKFYNHYGWLTTANSLVDDGELYSPIAFDILPSGRLKVSNDKIYINEPVIIRNTDINHSLIVYGYGEGGNPAGVHPFKIYSSKGDFLNFYVTNNEATGQPSYSMAMLVGNSSVSPYLGEMGFVDVSYTTLDKRAGVYQIFGNPASGTRIFLHTRAANSGEFKAVVSGYPNGGVSLGNAATSYTPPNDGVFIRGKVAIGDSNNNASAMLDLQGSTGYNQLRLRTSYTPTGSGDSNGNVGDIAWDNNYVYIKTSAGWKRTPLSAF